MAYHTVAELLAAHAISHRHVRDAINVQAAPRTYTLGAVKGWAAGHKPWPLVAVLATYALIQRRKRRGVPSVRFDAFARLCSLTAAEIAAAREERRRDHD